MQKAGLAYGVVALAIAFFLLSAGAFLPLVLYLLVNAVVVGGAFLWARRRHGLHFVWERREMMPTGEHFLDPTTGEVMEVLVDPKTGIRNIGPLRQVDADPRSQK